MRLNQLVVLFISIFSLLITAGCTSSQTEGDPATAEVTDESLEMAEPINNDDLSMDFDGGDDAFADLGESTEFSDSPDLALSEETATPPLEEAPLGVDDLSETPLAEEAPPIDAPVDELAPDFGAPAEDTALSDSTGAEPAPDFGAPIESAEPDFGEPTPEPTFSDPEAFASTDISTEPPADTETTEVDTAMTETGTVETESSEPNFIPLKKVISVPYMHAGKPVNGIYIARDGDTLQSISQKIFGGDRVSELCDINAYNCSRTLKVGDKYYYNSPQRPNDSETVKTFYEDAGIPAQTYVTQEGDNIRNLGSTLLGHPRSWMELWALNPDIESKGELPAGVALRYWPSTPVSLPTVAQTEPEVVESEPVAPAEPELPAMPEMAETAEPADSQPAAPTEQPPMEDMALNDIPEVPEGTVDMNEVVDDFAQNNAESDPAAMGSVEPPPPPPPPPPPMETAPPMDVAANETQFEDPNQTMALGVGAILLLAGVALFIAIRKRRARRPVDFNTTTQTQIE